MYVRVQLGEEPAWVREATAAEIVFLDEVERKRNMEAGDHQINMLAEEMERAQIKDGEWAQRREERKMLARERGEAEEERGLIVTIKENFDSQDEYAPAPPSLRSPPQTSRKS